MSGGPAMPPVGDRPVRTGVIGTGRIGRMHAELLATSVPGASLAAVSDAVMPLAEEVGQALGVPALETPSLIGHPEIDAVAVCAPTDTHVPLLMAAAEAGKAVFCEKPISLDLAEVDRALAVVAAGGHTADGRFQPPLRRVPCRRPRCGGRGLPWAASRCPHYQP